MPGGYIGDPMTAHVEAWAAVYRLECEARALLVLAQKEGRAAALAELNHPARAKRREQLRQIMNAMQMARRKQK